MTDVCLFLTVCSIFHFFVFLSSRRFRARMVVFVHPLLQAAGKKVTKDWLDTFGSLEKLAIMQPKSRCHALSRDVRPSARESRRVFGALAPAFRPRL
jgi:hypothetical protein